MAGKVVVMEALADYGSREEAYYGGVHDALALAELSGWLTAEQRASVDARVLAVRRNAEPGEGMCDGCGHYRPLARDSRGDLVCADCAF